MDMKREGPKFLIHEDGTTSVKPYTEEARMRDRKKDIVEVIAKGLLLRSTIRLNFRKKDLDDIDLIIKTTSVICNLRHELAKL